MFQHFHHDKFGILPSLTLFAIISESIFDAVLIQESSNASGIGIGGTANLLV